MDDHSNKGIDHECASDFHSRLKIILSKERSGLSFAKRAGLSASGFSRIEKGGEPGLKSLVMIAKAAGVRVEWLSTGSGPMTMDDLMPISPIAEGGLCRIQRYDIQASAGGGAVVDSEFPLEDLLFPKKWLEDAGLDPKSLNAISVKGDSMEPTIPDGHMVLVDRLDVRPRSGNIYVLNYDGDLLLKRLQKLVNGDIEIISDNPRYRTETVQVEQLGLLRVVGRVVWHCGSPM